MSSPPAPSPAALDFPIKVVSRRTGLTTAVIRVWERRYAVVTPRRTASDRRRYTEQDIARLTLLRRALEAGHRIGEIANLSSSDLAALTRDAEAGVDTGIGPAPGDHRAATALPHLLHLLQQCYDAVLRMDRRVLADLLARAAVEHSIPSLLGDVVAPLLVRIGTDWQQGLLRISHEHLTTAVIRAFLGRLEERNGGANAGPAIVLTTPVGQAHELGALMAGVHASHSGWSGVYLGPEVPAEEIVYAVEATHARAVALGITFPADDPRLTTEVTRLRSLLPAGVLLLAGGAAALLRRDVLVQAGSRVLASMDEFRAALDDLRRAPDSSQ